MFAMLLFEPLARGTHLVVDCTVSVPRFDLGCATRCHSVAYPVDGPLCHLNLSFRHANFTAFIHRAKHRETLREETQRSGNKEPGTRNTWKEENCNPTTSTSTFKHQYIFSSFSFLTHPEAARRAVTQRIPSFRFSLFFTHFRPRGCATRCPSMAYTLSCPLTNLRTSRPAFLTLDGSHHKPSPVLPFPPNKRRHVIDWKQTQQHDPEIPRRIAPTGLLSSEGLLSLHKTRSNLYCTTSYVKSCCHGQTTYFQPIWEKLTSSPSACK